MCNLSATHFKFSALSLYSNVHRAICFSFSFCNFALDEIWYYYNFLVHIQNSFKVNKMFLQTFFWPHTQNTLSFNSSKR